MSASRLASLVLALPVTLAVASLAHRAAPCASAAELPAPRESAPTRRVRVAALDGPSRVRLDDGRVLELYGLAEATAAPTAAVSQVAQSSSELELAGEWELLMLPAWRKQAGNTSSSCERAWLSRPGRALNLELVRAGRVAVAGDEVSGPQLAALVEAAQAAQAASAGIWAGLRPPPKASGGALAPRRGAPGPMRGVALPLHDLDPARSYEADLRELRALGARWVLISVASEQARVDASAVERHAARTPPPERIVATIEQARALGLEVLFMPIVLLREAGAGEWRGALRPADPAAWFRSYRSYLLHMADLAARGGASALCVGSEFATLEKHEAEWLATIQAARARFPGWLTYSANWDHFDRIGYWGALDFAAMTAYFTLSKAGSPSARELRAGWRHALEEVRRLARVSGLPAILSEVGIPSQTGALGSPWDYTRNAPVDLEAQRAGFAAFADVFLPQGEPAPGMHGFLLYDWWGQGGAQDGSYTARGKPAEAVWRALLAPPRAQAAEASAGATPGAAE